MRTFVHLIVLAAVSIGCSAKKPHQLGADFTGPAVPVQLTRQSNIDAPVIIEGVMSSKCPVAGCWFMLRDESGTIKVDTKNAGFVVVDVPVNTSLKVAGRLATNGSERFVEATGLRY